MNDGKFYLISIFAPLVELTGSMDAAIGLFVADSRPSRAFKCMSLEEWRENGRLPDDERGGVTLVAIDAADAAESWALQQIGTYNQPDEEESLDVIVLDNGEPLLFTCVCGHHIIVRAQPSPERES